jgi:hypothetical protein
VPADRHTVHLNSTRMSELARRSPVAYSTLFSLTAISMALLVVRSRVLSQRTGRCTMPGSLPDTHSRVILPGRCAGGGGRCRAGGMAGEAGRIDRRRHAGRVIALIIYRRGPRFIGTNSRTHGTVHWGAKHDVPRHKHDASTIMSSRSRPPPLRLVVSISGRSLLPPGTRLVPW